MDSVGRYVRELQRPVWKDAFALVSLLGPLMTLAVSLSYFVLIGVDPRLGSWTETYATAPIWGAYVLPAVAALFGLRRATAVLSFAASAILVTSPLWSDYWWTSTGAMGVLIVLGVISGAGSLLSAGPRRAGALMGLPALICAVVLALTACTLFPFLDQESMPMALVSMLPLFAAVILLPLLLLGTAHGRRTFALLLVAGSPLAAVFVGFSAGGMLGQAAVLVVLFPALTLVALTGAHVLLRRAIAGGTDGGGSV